MNEGSESEASEQKNQKEVSLEKLVAKPTWREMLLDLVITEKLDPWNIDLVEITSKYLKSIKKMQVLDLHIPANLILAASILLRFKSDAIRLEEEQPVVAQETFITEDGEPVEIPMLELRTRIPPKRKVSLDELVQAMEEVFESQRKREEALTAPKITPKMLIKLPEYDIEEKMKETLGRIKSGADTEGMITFSSLLKEGTREEIVHELLPLLFLANNRVIRIFQEKFFGEIFIQVLDEKSKTEVGRGKRGRGRRTG